MRFLLFIRAFFYELRAQKHFALRDLDSFAHFNEAASAAWDDYQHGTALPIYDGAARTQRKLEYAPPAQRIEVNLDPLRHYDLAMPASPNIKFVEQPPAGMKDPFPLDDRGAEPPIRNACCGEWLYRDADRLDRYWWCAKCHATESFACGFDAFGRKVNPDDPNRNPACPDRFIQDEKGAWSCPECGSTEPGRCLGEMQRGKDGLFAMAFAATAENIDRTRVEPEPIPERICAFCQKPVSESDLAVSFEGAMAHKACRSARGWDSLSDAALASARSSNVPVVVEQTGLTEAQPKIERPPSAARLPDSHGFEEAWPLSNRSRDDLWRTGPWPFPWVSAVKADEDQPYFAIVHAEPDLSEHSLIVNADGKPFMRLQVEPFTVVTGNTLPPNAIVGFDEQGRQIEVSGHQPTDVSDHQPISEVSTHQPIKHCVSAWCQAQWSGEPDSCPNCGNHGWSEKPIVVREGCIYVHPDCSGRYFTYVDFVKTENKPTHQWSCIDCRAVSPNSCRLGGAGSPKRLESGCEGLFYGDIWVCREHHCSSPDACHQRQGQHF